jgi:long-chain-fatty-acid--[acyl-carrier-protein] ligase
VRFLLSLRYCIEVKGLDPEIQKKLQRKGGILFLPNHPAELDPVLVIMVLFKRFRPRPLVVDDFYFLKGIRFFIKSVRALPLPNMDEKANAWKMQQINKTLTQILEDLKKGDNFLIYPSGKLKQAGEEIVGGSSLVHQLVQTHPEVSIVLVRTTGMWGSKFSRALTGSVPDFGKTLLEGLKIVLKNGLFFTPRRKVTIELAVPPSDFPKNGTRLEFNKALENWYNRYPQPGPEPLSLLPYYFWNKALPKVACSKKDLPLMDDSTIPEMVKQEIIAQVERLSKKTASEIKNEMLLSADLGLDSLDMAQMLLFLEERFDVEPAAYAELRTVADLLQAATGLKKQKTHKDPQPPSKWRSEVDRPEVSIAEGETIQEVFLRSCDRMGKFQACGDARFGVLTYAELKMRVLALSYCIKRFEGEYVAILLPASVAAYVVVLACLLAGRTAVMLNWTAGSRALDHALALCNFKHVISSRKFLNLLDTVDLGALDPYLCFLEDLKDQISWTDKLKAYYYSLRRAEVVLNALKLNKVSGDDRAVILFTSGTESLPKGVPLTHANLLSNERASLSCVAFKNDDMFYGVLPPFHSFGFSVTGLLPLLAGLRVYYAPDPNDHFSLARDIERCGITLFCTAPSFLRGVLRAAQPQQLSSMRLFVTGAEKASEELYETVHELGKQLIEGYGITECSPIVTLCRPELPPKGVGLPVPGVELMMVDSTTLKALNLGAEGEICISGPGVFKGYLGAMPDPFLEHAGKRWYRSGDRGFLDANGSLVLTGRLKRFVKIGGEMVSLAGLEEEILKLAKHKNWPMPADENGPVLAISVREVESEKPLIILFTTMELSRDEVNAALRESGYGRIVKIAEIKKIPQIPLTGTGKTHYRLLDDMV